MHSSGSQRSARARSASFCTAMLVAFGTLAGCGAESQSKGAARARAVEATDIWFTIPSLTTTKTHGELLATSEDIAADAENSAAPGERPDGSPWSGFSRFTWSDTTVVVQATNVPARTAFENPISGTAVTVGDTEARESHHNEAYRLIWADDAGNAISATSSSRSAIAALVGALTIASDATVTIDGETLTPETVIPASRVSTRYVLPYEVLGRTLLFTITAAPRGFLDLSQLLDGGTRRTVDGMPGYSAASGDAKHLAWQIAPGLIAALDATSLPLDDMVTLASTVESTDLQSWLDAGQGA